MKLIEKLKTIKTPRQYEEQYLKKIEEQIAIHQELELESWIKQDAKAIANMILAFEKKKNQSVEYKRTKEQVYWLEKYYIENRYLRFFYALNVNKKIAKEVPELLEKQISKRLKDNNMENQLKKVVKKYFNFRF